VNRRPPKSPELDQQDVSLLHNRNFTFLWGAQILSQIAQNLLNFALIIRVFQLAEGTRLANASVALLILSFGIPSVFFAAAAGVYVDHWNKKVVLVVANAVRAVLVLGYLAFEHNLYMVLLLSFLISTATQFFTPAESASLPSLVPKKHLLRANALFIFTLYASFIVGYSASGPVIAAFGAQGPYFLTAIMFALACGLVALLPKIKARESKTLPVRRLVQFTLGEIRNNWLLIRANHNLSFPILQLTITQSMLGVILALAPALSVAILGVPLEHSSHYLVIPAGLGMVAGVLLVGRLTAKLSRTRLIAAGLVIAAVALVLVGWANQLHGATAGHSIGNSTIANYKIGLIVAPLVFILGFMNAVVSVAAQTVLQEHTAEAHRGKVFGALNMMINIAATLPILFAGILSDVFGVSNVISALGTILLVFAITQYITLYRGHKLDVDTPSSL
jgi:MFS family permease